MHQGTLVPMQGYRPATHGEGFADALRPGGRLVIEGFGPPEEGMNDGGATVRQVAAAGVVSVYRHSHEV